MTRRQSRILLAAAVWTLYVWISRLVIMAGQDESAGFKAVHAVLALVSIGFALAIGKIGWDARKARAQARPAEARSAEARSAEARSAEARSAEARSAR